MRSSLKIAAVLALTLPPGLRSQDAPAAPPPPDYRQIAINAMDDLMVHFWVGSPADGHILPTNGGFHRPPLKRPGGGLWERATFYFAIDSLHDLTGDPVLAQRLRTEWYHVKTIYPPEKLQAVGEDSGTNWASDDAGWSALFYMAAWRATGDPDALADAKGVVNHAYARWMDDQLGGGMWYSDVRRDKEGNPRPRVKSLYAVALVYASLEIYQATHERPFLDRALGCYDWMESHLLRPDGLYWCDYGSQGPRGAERPADIHQAGSVSFLGGTMGMGATHILLYRLSSDDKYRQRAVHTATALRTGPMVDGNGVFIDDRDAWTNGTFAGEWARAVRMIPGMAPGDGAIIEKTAAAIYTKDRTPDGFYGPCWDGMPEGKVCPWKNSPPQQIMTSANAVNMIVAGAVCAAQ